MDSILVSLGSIVSYIPLIYPFVFLIAIFLLYNNFKTIETFISFYAYLLAVILKSVAFFYLQGVSATFSETGEVLSHTAPSFTYLLTIYISEIVGFISLISLLVFTIKLKRSKL